MTDTGQGKLIISSEDADAGGVDGGIEDADGAELELREARVPLESHGERLDLALTRMVPEFSRSYLQQLVTAGGVMLNGVPALKSSARVKASDLFRIELRPTAQSQAFKPDAMALEVVFEDDYLLVVNKPAGLVVHPAPGNWRGTLLNGLLARDPRMAALPRAGIVHRLDKDTSGLMVVARQRSVMDRLVEMIAARSVSRQYLALAQGTWKGAKTQRVELPVGRDVKNRLRMAVVNLDRNPGKSASTDITLLDQVAGYCLVQCRLDTGRTHQIRVHMSAKGHPLVSDALYGGTPITGLSRQALHAYRLAFEHPAGGKYLQFTSDLPPDMVTAINSLGLRYNEQGR